MIFENLFLDLAIKGLIIIFTLITIWLSVQSIIFHGKITGVVIFMWVFVAVLWSIIGLKVFIDYILDTPNLQYSLIVLVLVGFYFFPIQKNKNKLIKKKK